MTGAKAALALTHSGGASRWCEQVVPSSDKQTRGGAPGGILPSRRTSYATRASVRPPDGLCHRARDC